MKAMVSAASSFSYGASRIHCEFLNRFVTSLGSRDGCNTNTLVQSRVTTFKYWIVGTLTNDMSEATFLSALINSVGSVGSTFGFVVSRMKTNYNAACGINTALFFLSMPGLAWVAFTRISTTSHGTSLTGSAGQLQNESSSVEESKDAINVESGDEKVVPIATEKSVLAY